MTHSQLFQKERSIKYSTSSQTVVEPTIRFTMEWNQIGHSPSRTLWSPAMQMDLYPHCCTGRSCNHLSTELNHSNHADHFFSRHLPLSCCTCCGAFTEIVPTTPIHHLFVAYISESSLTGLILATVGGCITFSQRPPGALS